MGRNIRLLDSGRGTLRNMTLERITDIPRPDGVKTLEELIEYNKRLATALQEHMGMRPEDLQGLVNEYLPGIDEDDMTSNSAVHVPTQQSVKQYVDDQIGGIVMIDYAWTDDADGTHTGDTDWQTVINEGTGSGFAWINFGGNNYGTAVCEVTIDGGSAMTAIAKNQNTNYAFPIQYSSALLVRFRVSNDAHTVYYQAWWNNA